MEKTLEKLLLPSGRGVKLRLLTYEQVDNIELSVAGSANMHTGQGIVSVMQFNRLCSAEGATLMVAELTEVNGLAFDDLTKTETKWLKMLPEQLSGHLGDYFTAKDMVVLRGRYMREHDVSDAEMKEILEKKVVELVG